MNSPLLTRSAKRPESRPALAFLGDLALPLARAHEACGTARRLFACLVARETRGPVFWIAPAWQAERLNADALLRLFDPGRVLFIDPHRAEDLLWCLEEVLRSGAAPLAVADLPGPPGLTAVRRLHLAAETALAETGAAPLGLLLTPGAGGAQGIETRWRMQGAHGAGGVRAWQLERLRARMAPPRRWRVEPVGRDFRLTAPETEPAPEPA